jgi:uncharacterized membrane protein
MNSAHLHLMLTHVPILGSVFGLLLLVIALLKADHSLKPISLWLFVLAGLAAVPTYWSGRPASAVLLKVMPGMSMDPGDQHAEIAMVALVAASVLGLIALLGLTIYRRGVRAPGWFTALTFLLAVLTCGLMIWTASLGGNIRHPEIKPQAARGSRRPFAAHEWAVRLTYRRSLVKRPSSCS